jgi:mannitol-specific phosphotransferase system IIBC component
MVQKVKDRIMNSLLTIVTGAVVSIITVSYAFSKDEDKDETERIDAVEETKLSKEEYELDQQKRWESHDNIHNLENKAVDQLILEVQQSNEKTDWLYRNEINKANYSIPPLRK